MGYRHDISTLPSALLEMILVGHTNLQEKKSLRLVCRLFRDVLDDTMVSAQMLLQNGREQKNDPSNTRGTWLQSMQHRTCLRTLYIVNCSPDAEMCDSPLNPLHCLPTSLTSLHLYNVVTCLEPLAKLPALTSLALDCYPLPAEGITKLQGLTHLATSMNVGCVAHLAPTLQILELQHFSHVQGLQHLSKLKKLIAWSSLPSDCMQTLYHTPLKHIEWAPSFGLDLDRAEYWQHAPPTLDTLTIRGNNLKFEVGVLPTTIKSLQLISCPSDDVISQAVAALPNLGNLDVAIARFPRGWSAQLQCLTTLTQLETLTLRVKHVRSTARLGDVMATKLPVLRQLRSLGVHVSVMSQIGNIYARPWTAESKWSIASDNCTANPGLPYYHDCCLQRQ